MKNLFDKLIGIKFDNTVENIGVWYITPNKLNVFYTDEFINETFYNSNNSIEGEQLIYNKKRFKSLCKKNIV